jgi:hypothetical protein
MSNLKNTILGAIDSTTDRVTEQWDKITSTAKERQATCDICDTFDHKTHYCLSSKGGCGCYIPVKKFITFTDCPKDRWPKI